MSVERRILPIRSRRRGQRAASRSIFSLPLLLSTPSAANEEEDIRLSGDHAGNWTEYINRKIRSSDKSKSFPKPEEKQFVSVGIQHDGPQLPPSRRSARVGYGKTDSPLSHVADLFEGHGFYSFDFHSQESGIGQVTTPLKPTYTHAETQTPIDNLPQTQVPQWTYSKRRVRFVNRSRRKYMKEKRKVNRVHKNTENEEKEKEKEKETWICPFCDYEDIFKEPPYALISRYEMKEKEDWRRSTLQKSNRGNSAETHLFQRSYRVFPDSYYEWESRPPDGEGHHAADHSQDGASGYSHDCYDYGG